jgi:hypothetical protein
VLLSGLIWHGTPHALIEQVRTGALTLISSPTLIAELVELITRPKFRSALAQSNTDPERMLAESGAWPKLSFRVLWGHRLAAMLTTMRCRHSRTPLSLTSSFQTTWICSPSEPMRHPNRHAG